MQVNVRRKPLALDIIHLNCGNRSCMNLSRVDQDQEIQILFPYFEIFSVNRVISVEILVVNGDLKTSLRKI